MRPATFSLLLCFTLNIADSARILGVVNLAAYSHYSLGLSLMKELAAKGHDVTYISPYTEKNVTGKFRSIELTGFHDEMEEMKTKLNMFEVFASRAVPSLLRLHSLGLGITDKTLAHENVQKLLASNEQFDVIIIEQFINEALHGFCHHFKAPCIKLSPVRSCYWTNNFVGNPSNPAYIPEFSLGHSGPMNLYQRIQNTALHITTELLMHFHILPQQNELMHRYFPNAPPLRELLDDTPLVLLNSHVSTAPPMPHVPNMIEIGGYHVQPPKKLPEDLQKYLDGAKEGVVYFSMGSNLRSREIPVAKREAILRAFSKLKYKVLWKFEEDDLPGKPGNVMIKKWLPQQDILAHPNIKLFITHGGLLSTIEAIYHGVPVIGIPIFGDQVTNMLQAVQAGFGISLEYATLNEEIFSAALNEILSNSKYTENVKQRSRVMHDQPMKPIDTATFWVEYVARHKGAKHFRSAAMDLAWYQLLQLDVAAAILFLAITVLSISIFIMKTMFASDSSKVKVAKKKNK